MNVPRTLTAISLDQNRLCAVHGTVAADRVKVSSWLNSVAPVGTDVRDAASAGAWIASELDKAGMGRAKLVFAVPRGEVILKRMKLPRGEGASEADLAGMVRLQMTRQLTMAVEGTAIDYAPIGAAEGDSVSVLAGALPGERMAWYRDVAKAAGCKIERVGLRAAGLAALLAGVSQRHTGPILSVAAGWGSVEFVIIEDGQLVFARAADVGMGVQGPEPRPSEEAAGGATAPTFVSRVAVEAKRTWMSYRGAEGSAEVEAVVVPDRGALATELGQRCAEAVEMPFERAEMPGLIELPEMPEVDRLVLAPLIGLLGEDVLTRASLDFAHPRKAPDLAAAKRQRVLWGALAAIVFGGGGYVYSWLELGYLRDDLKAANLSGEKLAADSMDYLTQSAKLGHIQQWMNARVDWIAHLRFISEQMPDPRQALMDQVAGSLAARVDLICKEGKYDPNGWKLVQQAKFSIQGQTKQQTIANSLRDRLIAADAVYPSVETAGPDTPDRFALTLTTVAVSPEAALAPPPAKPPGPGKSEAGSSK